VARTVGQVSQDGAPRITIVVPTYRRGPRLLDTLGALLASRASGVETAELIVVDDGSPEPVSLDGLVVPGHFRVSLLRQENRGPAAARNAGFRAARGEFVLFVDDDILVPPDLVGAHLAAHARLGPAVVCGRCVLQPPERGQELYAYLEALGHDPGRDASEEFLPVPIVASGQISVRRDSFRGEGGVYREDLQTPGAEEFELSIRLRARGLPVVLATRITALHLQAVDIDSISRQQYKHGIGYAEAAAKCPEAMALPELARAVAAAGARGRTIGGLGRHLLKRAASAPGVRTGLLTAARASEAVPLPRVLRRLLYRAAISAHFVAGIRRGLGLYGTIRC